MIYFRDRLLTTLRPDEIARAGIARTFQITRLFFQLSVLDNVLLAKSHPGERLSVPFLAPRRMRACERSYRDECLHLLELVGLAEKQRVPAATLSYGQQKLLEIARALAMEAEQLLLDEPVAGVTPSMRQSIKELLIFLKGQGKTILLIEHNMRFVMNICDRVIAMHQGRVIADGSPNEVQQASQVREAYLGETVEHD